MVPLWMFPLALACGNTFVLKPSEKVPLCAASCLASCSNRPGFRKACSISSTAGGAAVDALLTHPKVKADLFVGSTPIAKYIWETGTKHGKRVQANGGAKTISSSCLMPTSARRSRTSPPPPSAARASAAWPARPPSAVGAAADRVLPDLAVKAAKAIQGRAGPTAPAQPDMGPLITAAHRDRVLSLVASGEREGAKVIADGRTAKVADAPNGFYVGATVVDGVQNHMTLAREEVFGPVLNVMRMDDLDAAIEQANRNPPYGKRRRDFHRATAGPPGNSQMRVKAGMVGITVGVPATMAMFPFTGWDESFYGDLHIQGKRGRAVLHAAKRSSVPAAGSAATSATCGRSNDASNACSAMQCVKVDMKLQ